MRDLPASGRANVQWLLSCWPILPGAFFIMLAGNQFSSWWCSRYPRGFAGLHELGLPEDGLIPFVPYSLLVYLGAFIFYLSYKPLLKAGRDQLHCYRAINTALIAMTALCCGFFIAFPAEVELREHALISLQTGAHASWITRLCLDFFALQGAANAWPSMVVSQTLVIMLALSRLKLYPVHELCVFWVYWLLLALSVLTLKLHYVWDVLTAVVLAIVCWGSWLLPRLDRCVERSTATSHMNWLR